MDSLTMKLAPESLDLDSRSVIISSSPASQRYLVFFLRKQNKTKQNKLNTKLQARSQRKPR